MKKKSKPIAARKAASARAGQAGAPAILARKEVLIFLVLVFAFSSVFYYLNATVKDRQSLMIFTIALMWCPALAAAITRLWCQRNLQGFGFGPGDVRWLLAGIFLPVLVGLVAFGSMWLTGIGPFNLASAEKMLSLSFLPAFLASIGFNLFAALGEELGWRGLLVPELSKFMGFTQLALLSSAIWAAWHLPLIIFGQYHGIGPLWFSLLVFIPQVMAAGVVLAWLRLKSGSVWVAVLFHGFWNYFIQQVYPALTVQTPASEMITGEFGWLGALLWVGVALVLWHYRGMLPRQANQPTG